MSIFRTELKISFAPIKLLFLVDFSVREEYIFSIIYINDSDGAR